MPDDMNLVKKWFQMQMKKKILIVAFWLLVWHLLALWVDNKILLVTPIETVFALGKLIVTKHFWLTVIGSLVRIAAGFLLGFAVACALAALASRFKGVEAVFEPVIGLLRAVPVASFVVLLLIWWGSPVLAVAICFLIVLPVIYINVLKGLKNADSKLLEMADVFSISRLNSFFYIYRPALRPFLESGLKLALGMCWKSGVAAEIIGTPDYSIGERLYMSKIHLDTEGLFAWTVVVILLSIGFEKLFMGLVKVFMKWEPKCTVACRQCSDDKKKTENLKIQKLFKAYGDLHVVKDFNAEYEPDGIYYFDAPSGSGKTTLFRLLCGLEQPDAGTIQNQSLRFSYAFQEDRLCEEYSAVRNVELVAACDAENALREVLPEEALFKPCCQLSGGMRRRVAVVRAMEADSDCVILDEPFAGLDKKSKEQVEMYIQSRQRGRILLIASHESSAEGENVGENCVKYG